MITRCYLCGGMLLRGEVTAENWWGDELTLIEGVPAWVCQQCGEVYFDASTSRALDRLRRKRPVPDRTVVVPVYRFDCVA